MAKSDFCHFLSYPKAFILRVEKISVQQKGQIGETFSWFEAMAASVDGLLIVDKQHHIKSCSNTVAILLGKDPIQLTGHLLFEALPNLPPAFISSPSKSFHWKYIDADNKPHSYCVTFAHFIEDGNSYTTLTFKNQTQLEFLEHHLFALQSEFESVFTQAIDSIIFINENGIIRKVNPATTSLFGYEKIELLGKNISLLMPAPDRANHDQYIQNYLKSGKAKIIGIGRAVEGLRKDGKSFPMRLSVNEVTTESGKIFTGIIQDLTQEKKAEEKIKKLNASLEDKVTVRTAELSKTVSKLLSANKKMEQILLQKENITKALLQSELELKESLRKEKDLGDLKSRFVTTASHEFRTPLSSILSSAEIVQKLLEKNDIERPKNHLERIIRSVETLTSILEEFLSLSRLEEGMQQVIIREVRLSALLEEVINDFSPSLKKGQTILIEPNNSDLSLFTDGKILKQVLTNLFSNASKYSSAKNDIICKLEQENDQIRIAIIDHGIGIPPDDVPHLFSRFFRAQNAINIQGTGLGLNIIKRFLTLIQGNIKVYSILGEGSVFTIRLPLKLKPL